MDVRTLTIRIEGKRRKFICLMNGQEFYIWSTDFGGVVLVYLAPIIEHIAAVFNIDEQRLPTYAYFSVNQEAAESVLRCERLNLSFDTAQPDTDVRIHLIGLESVECPPYIHTHYRSPRCPFNLSLRQCLRSHGT